MGRFDRHDDIDHGLDDNGDGQDDAADHDVADNFCPTFTLSSQVSSVSWVSDGSRLLSSGGKDTAILQWATL